jgi:hypothetical protein
MIAPAIFENRFSFCNKNCPKTVADAPRATKISENPTMNNIEFRVTFLKSSERVLCTISSKLYPLMNDKYPGTIGKTHGDIKEIIPNINAVRIFTLSNFSSSSSYMGS